MKLKSITIENFRAIQKLELPLHPQLTVLVGDNAAGKTTILDAIATGLGVIPTHLGVKGKSFNQGDIRKMILNTQGEGSKIQSIGSKIAPYARITLESTNQLIWAVTKKGNNFDDRKLPTTPGRKALFAYLDGILNNIEEDKPALLPVIAYYGADRMVFSATFKRNLNKQFSRVQSLENALAATPSFTTMLEWFVLYEDLERRERERVRDFGYTSPWLNAFREVIKTMLPGCSNLRTVTRPTRFMVDFQYRKNRTEVLNIDKLSDGYRAALVVVMDLARRMIQANPHLEEKAVVESEAVVLIDEVDLHLHPQWQQRVLVDLMRTFPKAQFIVTTHSPQVLTTINPEHIIKVHRLINGIVAELKPSEYTLGAKSGKLLSRVMDVNERPPNEFKQLLDQYYELIEDNQWESEDALKIRQRLYQLSPNDPELISVKMEIRRRRALYRETHEESQAT